MTNYKPFHDGINGKDIQIGTKTPKTLWDNVNLMTAPTSLQDAATGALYQVPTGKTFTSTAIIINSTAGALRWAIFEGDTEDAITSIKMRLWGNNTGNQTYPLFADFAAGKFITGDAESGAFLYSIILLGYEH